MKAAMITAQSMKSYPLPTYKSIHFRSIRYPGYFQESVILVTFKNTTPITISEFELA